MWKGFFEYNINNVDTVGYIRITYKTVGTVEEKVKNTKVRFLWYLLLSLTTTRCSTTKWTYFIVNKLTLYKYEY